MVIISAEKYLFRNRYGTNVCSKIRCVIIIGNGYLANQLHAATTQCTGKASAQKKQTSTRNRQTLQVTGE